MTKAPERIPELPERIWAYDGTGHGEMGGWSNAQHAPHPDIHEYISADHALALVAAAYEDAAGTAKEVIDVKAMAAPQCIRARTPDDAAAALKARDQRIRNEALRDAAEKVKQSRHIPGTNLIEVTETEQSKAIEALITEGQSDG